MKIHLPVHPRTGLTAIGFRRCGTPIWPVMGGDGTGDPVPPTPPADPPTPPPVVPPVPPAPAAFDPTNLPPEMQEYLRTERARIAAAEGGKARDTARETARREALADLAKAWGQGDKPVDPAAAAAELVAARAEARTLRIDQAIDRAARDVKGDGDLVGALLAKHHAPALAALDPTAADFADKIKTLVTDLVKGNPRLLLDSTTPVGGQAPVNGGFNGAPSDGQRPSMSGAIANWYSGNRR